MRIVLAAALLAALSACGGANDKDTTPTVTVDKAAECTELLAPLKDSVQELDSRFRTGLDMDEFDERAGDVQVEVDKVAGQEAEKITAECGDAYSSLAGVTDAAKSVKNAWAACQSGSEFVDLMTCDSSTDLLGIDPDAGASFSTALSRAETQLSNVG